MNIKDVIKKIVVGTNLSEEEMVSAMNEVMTGLATPAQIASFITALRMKGESVDEIVGAVRVMREKATYIDGGVDTSSGNILMDIVGTGGDGADTFNVSTATSFVVAAAGVPIAKHGNRAVSSKCGSADVLEELGVDLSLPAEQISKAVQQVGIGFLFAPMLHGAMKHAIGPRKEMGIRTIFNILGPLTNPAGANVQLIGVFDKDLTSVLAEVLMKLGEKRSLVVWGEGNMDELTVCGISHIAESFAGKVKQYVISPEDVGLSLASVEDITGGDSIAESAAIVRDVLDGKPGARLDMVLLNAGAALFAAEKATSIKKGVVLARQIVESGAAKAKLQELIDFCNKGK
ncbi:MAG: anthranilate phosphoribosyltransferase [Desulfotalea sp.]